MLTVRQKAVLDYIAAATSANGGVCPSYREIAGAVGWKRPSAVHRVLQGLEERGFIRRIPNRARAVEVIRQPVCRPQPMRLCAAIPMMGRINSAGWSTGSSRGS